MDAAAPSERWPSVARSPLLNGLEPGETEEVLSRAVPRTLAGGETLFREGEAVEALYVVESGALKLWQSTAEGNEVIVRTVGAGAIVAGVALLEKRTLPVSASAIVESRVLVWPRQRILELAARFPLLRRNVIETIADRMRDSLSRIRELSTESVERRIARALLRLVREAGRPLSPPAVGTLIDRKLGRRELAELSGASMFTASRVVAAWAREGILEVGRQRIVVRSIPRLALAAGEEGSRP